MYSYSKFHGGVKQSRVPKTATQKAKLMKARAPVAKQNRAVASAQQRGAIMYRTVGQTENKFYDPWTANGAKRLLGNTAAPVSDSAGAYILATAANPGAVVLNQIPQGTTQNTRLGRRAHMTGVRIKGRMLNSSAGATNPTVVSLNLIHQTTPNNPSSMPAYNAIWTAQSNGALRVVNDADKLKVVRSMSFELIGNVGASTTGKETVDVDEFIDLKKYNIITEWTSADTTGVYGNMERGALLLYVLGSTAEDQDFYGSVRVYYNDY